MSIYKAFSTDWMVCFRNVYLILKEQNDNFDEGSLAAISIEQSAILIFRHFEPMCVPALASLRHLTLFLSTRSQKEGQPDPESYLVVLEKCAIPQTTQLKFPMYTYMKEYASDQSRILVTELS